MLSGIRFKHIAFFCLFCLLVSACVPSTPAAVQKLPSTEAPAPITNTPRLGDGAILEKWEAMQYAQSLVVVDPAAGKVLAGYPPIPLHQSSINTTSSDGRRLAVITYSDQQVYTETTLHVVDLQTWQDQPLVLPYKSWVNAAAFSPDGQLLAVEFDSPWNTVVLIDLKTNKITAHADFSQSPQALKFTSAGDGLMVFTAQRGTFDPAKGTPQALWLTLPDLKSRWTQSLADVRAGLFLNPGVASSSDYKPGTGKYLSPMVVFSPLENRLYIVHADDNRLTSVDFDSRSVKTQQIRKSLSWFERLLSFGATPVEAKFTDGTNKSGVISLDGKRIYVVGQTNVSVKQNDSDWQVNQTDLGLQVIDTASSTEVGRMDTHAYGVSLSADGRFVLLMGPSENTTNYSPDTMLLSTHDLKVLANFKNTAVYPTRRLDGRPLLVTSSQTSAYQVDLGVIDPITFKIDHAWQADVQDSWLMLP